MSATDKFKNATDSAMGSAKEKVGDATHDHDLQAEGRAQHAVGQAKQTGENVEDTARDITGQAQ